MKKIKGTLLATAVAFALAPSSLLVAQQAAATATVHGHVQNAAGQLLPGGDVKFTKDHTAPSASTKFDYTFPLGKDGNYAATGVAPGDYVVYVIVGDKRVDYQQVAVKAGDDKTVDFDMTREEYLKTMSPEERKNLEEYKKKNEAATSANKVIANLNTVLKQTRDDLNAAAKNNHADVSKDVDAMKTAVDSKPDESLLWITYGDTLQAQADHLAQVDRDAKKPPSQDDAVVKAYSDAGDAYKKGIDLSAASKKPTAASDGAIASNQMGNSLAKAGKTADASAAFENAAKLDPTKAGMYYNNEAAILFNNNKPDDALAAANKAIAADPNRPDPYFIKGQVLVQKATVDPKTNLPIAPPGCLDAYQKYLELAPDGANAPTVKEILTSFGQKIDTRYKSGKKG